MSRQSSYITGSNRRFVTLTRLLFAHMLRLRAAQGDAGDHCCESVETNHAHGSCRQYLRAIDGFEPREQR